MLVSFGEAIVLASGHLSFPMAEGTFTNLLMTSPPDWAFATVPTDQLKRRGGFLMAAWLHLTQSTRSYSNGRNRQAR
jgi:hypothetical protein